MPDHESVRSVGTARQEIRPWVAEAIASAGDERLSADRLSAAARLAITAWVNAVTGDGAALASIASDDLAHWLLHPPMKRWQVAPGPTVTEIELRHLDIGEQPVLGVSFRFAGRKQTDDGVADETLFAGRFNLALADGGTWRLVSAGVQTLDEFYGYVFTSRDETAEEYLARTGSPLGASGTDRPHVFRVIAGFAEHDERFGSSASLDVERPAAPDRDEAERLAWPAVHAVTVAALGEGDWRPSLNWIDVIGLRALPQDASRPEGDPA